MLLYSCVKRQAQKNGIYITTCETITSMNDRVCQNFDWALTRTVKWDQNTAPTLLQKPTLLSLSGALPAKHTASDPAPQN